AAAATRSANTQGFPLCPKLGDSPFCRGSYNSFILWIKQLALPRATHIFDVGANHGDFARAASVLFPKAQVKLFEPLPILWPTLERQVALHNGFWQLERFAVGASADRLPLGIAPGDDAIASLMGFSPDYREANPAVDQTQIVETEVKSLDQFCAETGINSIDLLKIDVEGFEFEVIKGATEMLRHTTAMIAEISLIRQAGGFPGALQQMIALLNHAEFHIVDVIPSLFSCAEAWRPLEYNLLARRA
ncbi:MAG: FkbM family methyltransferase, partial [Chthoniobacterales bacterium]